MGRFLAFLAWGPGALAWLFPFIALAALVAAGCWLYVAGYQQSVTAVACLCIGAAIGFFWRWPR